MSHAKEIRTKIHSIQGTKKITKAMEMVAASKMRKAQVRMQTSRPYNDKIRTVISHLAHSHAEYRNLYMQTPLTKGIGIIVVSSDRGLCGSLHANLFKTTIQQMKLHADQGSNISLCTLGNKAEAFFRRFGGQIVAHANHIGDAPSVNALIGIVKIMLDQYKNGEIGKLFIACNRFVNTMQQKPLIQQLLPLEPSEDEKLSFYWDYIYEPNSKELLDLLLQRYIESQVYQSVVENIACEQAARMVAMKNASDNANELIGNLKLIYNKARQAAITQEIAEIVSGAAAV